MEVNRIVLGLLTYYVTKHTVHCLLYFYCSILLNVHIFMETHINSPPTLVPQSFFYSYVLNSSTTNDPSRKFLGNCKRLQG